MPEPVAVVNSEPSGGEMVYELKQDDLLCLLHIPKTAGMSLISLLDAMFDRSLVFRWHTVRRTPTPRWIGYIPLSMNRYRLIRGHYLVLSPDSIVRGIVPREPIIMTMLRDSMARVVSDYRHRIRQNHIPKHTSLMDYVTSPRYQ
jgi:hypothetical protein